MTKYILLTLAILAVAGAAIGYYLYNKPVASLEQAEADVVLTAPELLAEFQADEAAANEKYLDKVIQVRGELEAVTDNETGNTSLRLAAGDPMSGVICELEPGVAGGFEAGQTVTLKGQCTGMLMDVVLVRCVPVQETTEL